jgi:hypothetical protein
MRANVLLIEFGHATVEKLSIFLSLWIYLAALGPDRPSVLLNA